MNIKEGDIIICINNGLENDTIKKPMLTLNKGYVVIGVDRWQTANKVFVKVSNDIGIRFGYYSFRFCSLAEYRKMKLERLSFMSE